MHGEIPLKCILQVTITRLVIYRDRETDIIYYAHKIIVNV